MYIEKVAIKNFKAIDDIEIEFRPGVNLLIGDNGVGKTSIVSNCSWLGWISYGYFWCSI